MFFPGAFGTLDELAETLTLLQTGKINPAPVILVGVEFWAPFQAFIKNQLIPNKLISPDDLNLYTITDDEDEIMRIIIKHSESLETK